MHRVVVLALDGVYPFELGIPHRVFGSADGRYEVVTCSVDGRPVPSDSDFAVDVGHGPDALTTADTVVIPPFDLRQATAELPARVLRAFELIPPGARTVSICTGAFALAATGRLDGRRATTHWALAAEFRRLFPAVDLDADVLFIDDGDVLTSAGAASGMDVCLHVVRNDHGAELANRVARLCVVPPWRDGGQAQYIEHPVPAAAAAGTSATRQWALERLHLPLTMADLAAHAQMSLRTFARRFRDEVGMSPGRWVIQQRVVRARQLLESSDLSVDQVAVRAGFATAASLRQHLQAAIGVAPLAYRRTFRTAERVES
ncbi:GlxA family transcriptional regulator [Streptomyces nanshensis]|uniref:AraC family transcriptional regulator n=1 Tax=Streptomyces nanshensis TaxID=518642 RepID=A0A1E7L4K5_9ACTN|nr:helix-turn-helix domain-containing protein [Streptomyces nanshensis]OEV10953.1 AraC family transcriptional regulator [Streptomyces nanshensis]